LRDNLVSLTSQLDETNRAWQQYQQTQLDILRNQLQNCLSIDSNTSFDEIAQQIVAQVTEEREDFDERYGTLEKANADLRLGS
jgi:predicted negative regulator of RcsB-dependent stress response